MSRLWIARHAEAVPDQSGLSEVGRRQAALLGERLAGAGIARISHSPLARANETASIVAAHLPGVPVAPAGELTDAIPSDDPAAADAMVALFADPPADHLLITHNFQVAWFVRAVLQSPPDRWQALNSCNAALTVIRYAPARPTVPLVFNDYSHLPEPLRWTGFPPELRL